MKYLLAGAISFLLVGCAYSVDSSPPIEDAGIQDSVSETNPLIDTGTIPLPEAGSWDQPLFDTENINYYGGQVMTSPINVYIIWYGTWNDPVAKEIVINLVNNIGSTNYFKIDQLYYQFPDAQAPLQDAGSDSSITNFQYRSLRSKPVITINDAGGYDYDPDGGNYIHVNNSITVVADWSIGYTHGAIILDTDVQAIVNETLTANNQQPDINGIYFVLASADIQEGDPYFGGFCNSYCGWHNMMWIGNVPVKYSFEENTAQCLSDCSMHDYYTDAGFTQSPNNDWGTDGMMSIVAHELQEMATEPNPEDTVIGEASSWQDIYGAETADKCAWTFGTLYLTTSGTVANLNVGARDYLIQQQWNPALSDGGQGCSLSP